MGTYLGKPKIEKESHDAEHDSVACGASCMQGWRESQEDAHNCILDFDKKVSLFAVYDGHGGAEVAQYAAEKLPALVKNNFYHQGDYQQALITAYLEFDKELVEQSVVDKLTALRNGLGPDVSECDDGEEEEEEGLNELYEEAKMPLEDIISRYEKKGLGLKNFPISKVEDQPCSSTSSSSKLKSTDGDKTNTNGVNENKPEASCETAGSIKVNGTPKNEAECGPSSSKGTSCTGIKSGLECLITGDLANDDEDEDDEIFVAPPNIHHLNDSDTSDEDDDVAGDDKEEENDDEEGAWVLDDDDDDEVNVNDNDDDDDDDDDDDGDDNHFQDYDGFVFDNDDEDEETAGKDSGCTAVMALLADNKLYVANAGDSRCVVSIEGKAHDMSKDHKPEDEPELKRIHAAGGKVSVDGRVNGGLNLSRALGDHNYKKNKDLPDTEQMITALPDVSILDMKSENIDFIVLACDGIWNSLSSQEVVDFISERIDKPDVKLSSICEELFDTCLAPNTLSDGTGCDNMTCIIVKLTYNSKRSRTDDKENKSDDESVECKKFKTDSTEPESIH